MSVGLITVGKARGWIGTPYRHQASKRGAGADCLGLIRGVWRELNGPEPIRVPHYTPDWSEATGDEVLWRAARLYLDEKPLPEMETGDVVLFRMRSGFVAKHLGILSEQGETPRFIHAYSGHGVIENALTTAWQRKIVACFEFPVRSN